jgi:acyl carrier protein
MVDLERDVRGFITENFILDGQDIASDASLTQQGVLDSMGVLELIMFIEERFGVKVPDEDTLPENLDSVARIVHYVGSRLDQGRG